MSGRSQLAVCQLTKWWVADLLARPWNTFLRVSHRPTGSELAGAPPTSSWSPVPDWRRSGCRRMMTSLMMSQTTLEVLPVTSHDVIGKRQIGFTDWTNQIQPPPTRCHCLLAPPIRL